VFERSLTRIGQLLLSVSVGALAAGTATAGAQAPLPTLPVGANQGTVQPYATNDYGGFRNVLPPGTNGLDNPAQLGAFLATGARPAHNNDQLGMYANLIKFAPDIKAADLPQFYKDATFGVPQGSVAGSESPGQRSDVTIVRDKQFGVPHIYGSTRPGLMFGIGYATAEDRLFFIDVLRHAGESDLASFAGGANAAMDAGQWQVAPYSPQDLQRQAAFVRDHLPDGQQIFDDAQNYVAGINAYINMAKINQSMMPGEYAALGMPQGPRPFADTDLISIASLVGGIFGQGGGNELPNAQLEQALTKRFGVTNRLLPGSPNAIARRSPRRHRRARHRRHRRSHRRLSATHRHPRRHLRLRHRRAHRARHSRGVGGAANASGFDVFLDFVRPNDPEAPATVHNGASFAYRTPPLRSAPGSLAMPDPGTVQMANVKGAAGRSAGARGAASTGPNPSAAANRGLLALPRTESNALLVSGAHSASGHPLAVMGPQVAYFAPEILMEQDIHGPGIDANGAAFPGVNLYVELGHGRDYAWSATSAGQDIIDTFAVPLCDPNGGAPSLQSDHYLYQGRCVPMETLTRSEAWTPNPADSTPAGSQTLTEQRTMLGLVSARANVGGRPVAYTRLRSTYMHELDSAQGFLQYNDPARMRNPTDFMNASYQIGYTFNWFYTDDKHIAYFNSGHNPVRAPGTNPFFPTSASFPWQGFDPSNYTSAQTPQSEHPQAVDQDFLTSWNNKQAPAYQNPDTDQEYASIYRSLLLDQGIHSFLDPGRKMTLPDLVNVMGNAATQDLRGVTVLPYALQILGQPADPQLAAAVATLRDWVNSGAHRVDRSGRGHYDHAEAVRIMDAWWPRLVNAQFGPALGPDLLAQIKSHFPINDQAGHGVSGEHLGSAWDVGFYGVSQKDLRTLLGQRVNGALSHPYCGAGSLAACRAALSSSLTEALSQSASQVYPADGVCATGDQACSDSIRFRPLGAISQPLIPWQNRPTFQQAIEIPGHGAR